jgi:hypothetical protein
MKIFMRAKSSSFFFSRMHHATPEMKAGQDAAPETCAPATLHRLEKAYKTLKRPNLGLKTLICGFCCADFAAISSTIRTGTARFFASFFNANLLHFKSLVFFGGSG